MDKKKLIMLIVVLVLSIAFHVVIAINYNAIPEVNKDVRVLISVIMTVLYITVISFMVYIYDDTVNYMIIEVLIGMWIYNLITAATYVVPSV